MIVLIGQRHSAAAIMLLAANLFVVGCSNLPEEQRGRDQAQQQSEPAPSPKVTEVHLVEEGGTYTVPVTINDAIKLNFVIDSGASDVQIPADVIATMVRSRTLDRSDFIGQKVYRLADGSTLPSVVFRIRSLQVGDLLIKNVTGSIASENGELLLGQSFLSRIGSWSIDNARGVLTLAGEKSGGEATPRPEALAHAAPPEPPIVTPVNSSETDLRASLQNYLYVGGQNDISQISAIYADSINFYGKMQSRQEVLSQKIDYINRWPIRSWSLREGTFSYQCSSSGECLTNAIFDWSTSSPTANRHAAGSSRVTIGFTNGQVTYEWSKVISRQP